MNVQDRLAHYGISPDELMDLAGQIAAAQFARESEELIESPGMAERVFRPYLAGRAEEAFAVAFLDTRHRIIKLEILFRGTVDSAAVYPRVVAERALRYGASAVIFAHNHPGGSAEPSFSDRAITARLKEVLLLIDVRVLDHIVIGAREARSVEFDEDPAGTKRRQRGTSTKPHGKPTKRATAA